MQPAAREEVTIDAAGGAGLVVSPAFRLDRGKLSRYSCGRSPRSEAMRDDIFQTDPTITPAQLAELTGVSTDTQRDWRRRGIIEGLGVIQGNGRWLYDAIDVLVLCIMRHIAKSSVDLLSARYIAGMMIPMVVMQTVHDRRLLPDHKIPNIRFRIAYPDATRREGWSLVDSWKMPFDKFGKWPGHPVSLLIDTSAIAATIPAYFDEKFKAQAERVVAQIEAQDRATEEFYAPIFAEMERQEDQES